MNLSIQSGCTHTYESVSKSDLKKLLAACTEVVIRIIFETHCYKFGGVCYQQTDGGPIGLRVTNSIAKLRIANWISTVRRYLEDNNIMVHMAKSYVDDIRWLLDKIAKGIVWCKASKSLIFDNNQFMIDKYKSDSENKENCS